MVSGKLTFLCLPLDEGLDTSNTLTRTSAAVLETGKNKSKKCAGEPGRKDEALFSALTMHSCVVLLNWVRLHV